MPKVHFVHENVTVDVETGRRLSDIAKERGIAVCRQTLGWTGVGNYSVWVDGEPGSVSEPSFRERLSRVQGQRRLANHVRVHGDIRVWTQQGLAGRLGGTRNIDTAPNPSDNPDQVRTIHDEAGTAWCPYGHPSAVGLGKREPPKFEPKAKAAAKKAAAKPAGEKKSDEKAKAET